MESAGELVGRVRRGDADAFDALYRLTVPAVRRVAYAVMGDADAAKDIVQETFARAFERLDDLREDDRFVAWVSSIARHLAADHGRQQSRVVVLEDRMAAALATEEAGPAEVLELCELSDLVRAGMAQLCPRDATAVFVTQLGMAPADVAAVMGVTPGAARVIVHRARARLRNALCLADPTA